MSEKNIGIIILAAGASRRFGSPKQLAKFEDKTLIARITKTAISTGFQTAVVLGANEDRVRKPIENHAPGIVVNKKWKEGLSSSIKAGLEKLLDVNAETEAVILLLCDQPFVTKETILRLVRAQLETGKVIVACKYANTVGTPALFTAEVFDELLALVGDKGAKNLIEVYKNRSLAIVAAPEAALDVDTIEDLNRLTGA